MTVFDVLLHVFPAFPFLLLLIEGWIWVGLIGCFCIAPWISAWLYRRIGALPLFLRLPREVREFRYDEVVGERTERGVLYSKDDGRSALIFVGELSGPEESARFRFPLVPRFTVQENEQDKTLYFPIWPLAATLIWGKRRLDRKWLFTFWWID